MEASGWIQFAIFIVALALITKPMGLYLMHVLDVNGRTWLDPVLRPLERATYRVMSVDSRKEHDWKQYTLAMLLFSLVGCLFTYAILRLQYFLPLNPQKLAGVSPDLSFNTATSFTTNTNWQNYGGESTMSYFSQMVGLAFHNFVSAATGIAIAAALVRAIARHSATTLGNFWVDLVRVTYYLLLPICLVFAVFLVSQGMIQNFKPYTKATLVEPMKVQVEKKNDSGETIKGPDGKPVTEEQTVTDQNIVQGPMASQVAIKMLGTNGGGYVNANASHPFENPTPLSNFFQMLSIFSIGTGLTYYLGRMVKNQKHGWTVWAAMVILFVSGVLLCWWAEANGNPIHQSLGVAGGNMEGKEVRFGIYSSSLFATITTDASCGAVNSMHDSYTPLGGLVPIANIALGEIIFGGVGSGLYGMLIWAVVAVFIAGLMVGRTPEYLGKKIQAYDMKMSSLVILIPCALVVVGTAVAVLAPAGVAGIANPGIHGFSEVLYALSSASNNNGSAFAGLSANTPFYNTLLGICMYFARFPLAIGMLAIAGSLAAKKHVPPSAGTLPTHTQLFVTLLAVTVIVIGALTFLPALALGPIAEHLMGAR